MSGAVAVTASRQTARVRPGERWARRSPGPRPGGHLAQLVQVWL